MFWDELFRLIAAGFQKIGMLEHDPNAALKLTLMMNLDTTPEGEERAIPDSKLEEGVTERFWPVVERVRPRIVLALTGKVYDFILEDLEKNGSGSMAREEEHEVGAGNKSYHARSCWVTHPGVGQFLMAKLLQHPTKEHTYHRYRHRFSAYVGRRFRDALCVRPERD